MSTARRARPKIRNEAENADGIVFNLTLTMYHYCFCGNSFCRPSSV